MGILISTSGIELCLAAPAWEYCQTGRCGELIRWVLFPCSAGRCHNCFEYKARKAATFSPSVLTPITFSPNRILCHHRARTEAATAPSSPRRLRRSPQHTFFPPPNMIASLVLFWWIVHNNFICWFENKKDLPLYVIFTCYFSGSYRLLICHGILFYYLRVEKHCLAFLWNRICKRRCLGTQGGRNWSEHKDFKVE